MATAMTTAATTTTTMTTTTTATAQVRNLYVPDPTNEYLSKLFQL